MENEYYGVASTPMDDYLAHYGVKGMKWGVRKAIASGNGRRLGRQYAKAAKKLAKLEKRAAKADRYARRAKALGVGAAAAGGLAVAGTEGVSRGIVKVGGATMKASKHLGTGMVRAGELASKVGLRKTGSRMIKTGNVMQVAGRNKGGIYKGFAGVSGAVNRWGNASTLSEAARKGLGQAQVGITKVSKTAGGATLGVTGGAAKALNGVSNNTLARIGAGALGAGLAAGAAKNAYRAKTAQKKAAQFRSEMNKAFAGTKYASGGSSSSSAKSSSSSTSSRKRRRR